MIQPVSHKAGFRDIHGNSVTYHTSVYAERCEYCGKHLPVGTKIFISSNGYVYCSKKCAKELD